MLDTAEEVRTNSYSRGPLHMDDQKLDDQLEPIYKSSADTGCSREELPGAMDDSDGWQERVRDIRAGSATWWWCPEKNKCLIRHADELKFQKSDEVVVQG